MGTAKFEVEKFIGQNDFGLWRLKMRVLLIGQKFIGQNDFEPWRQKVEKGVKGENDCWGLVKA